MKKLIVFIVAVTFFSCKKEKEIIQKPMSSSYKTFFNYPADNKNKLTIRDVIGDSLTSHRFGEASERYAPEWNEVYFNDSIVKIDFGDEVFSEFQGIIYLNPQHTCLLARKSHVETRPLYIIAANKNKLKTYCLGTCSKSIWGGYDESIVHSNYKNYEKFESIKDSVIRLGNDFMIDRFNAKLYQINMNFPNDALEYDYIASSKDKKTLIFFSFSRYEILQHHYPTNQRVKIDIGERKDDNINFKILFHDNFIDNSENWIKDKSGKYWLDESKFNQGHNKMINELRQESSCSGYPSK